MLHLCVPPWSCASVLWHKQLPGSVLHCWSALGSTLSWVHHLSVKSVHSWSCCLFPTLENSAEIHTRSILITDIIYVLCSEPTTANPKFFGQSGTMSFTTHSDLNSVICTETISICFFCAELWLVMLSLVKHWYAWTDIIQDCFIQSRGMCTVQGRPSTVVSLKDWPTVNEMCVVRTLVDVLMDRLSPCWVISNAGLDAAVTAIFLRKTFTPDHTQTDPTSDFWRLETKQPNFKNTQVSEMFITTDFWSHGMLQKMVASNLKHVWFVPNSSQHANPLISLKSSLPWRFLRNSLQKDWGASSTKPSKPYVDDEYIALPHPKMKIKTWSGTRGWYNIYEKTTA